MSAASPPAAADPPPAPALRASAKLSLLTFWVLAALALFLWYRGAPLDRVVAPFLFSLAALALLEYGAHSGAEPRQGGRAAFVAAWVGPLILAVGAFVAVDAAARAAPALRALQDLRRAALAALVAAALGFVALLLFALAADAPLSIAAGPAGLEWRRGGAPLLAPLGGVYVAAVLAPFALLAAVPGAPFARPAGALAAVVAGTGLAAAAFSTPATLPSAWLAFAPALGFTAWLAGLVRPAGSPS